MPSSTATTRWSSPPRPSRRSWWSGPTSSPISSRAGPTPGCAMPRGPRRPRWSRSGLFFAGAVLTGAVGLAALAAPLLSPQDPDEQVDAAVAHDRPPGTVLAAIHLADGSWRLAERAERTPAGLSVLRLGNREVLAAGEVRNLTASGVADHRRFLLGSDRFGRDILSRMLYGARVSLAVGVLAVLLAATLGAAVGSAPALGGPWVDAALMRTVDALLAFPWLFFLILIAALFRPTGLFVILFLGGTGWMGVSRLARAEILSLR